MGMPPAEAAELAARHGFGAYALTTGDSNQPSEGPGSMAGAMLWAVALVAGGALVVAADSVGLRVLGVLLLAVVVATFVRLLLRQRREFAEQDQLHCFEGGVVLRDQAYPWSEVEISERWDTQLVGQAATPRKVLYLTVSTPGFRIEVRGGTTQIRELAQRGGATR